MTSTASRGRLLLMIAVTLLIVERLALAGLALANYNQPQFNWTAVFLPLTHIAVVGFLLFTSDLLIYWLVITWGIITAGHFSWLFLNRWRVIVSHEKTFDLTKFALNNWPILALILFHLLLTVLFLMPSVREYLSHLRSKLDFEEEPLTPASPPALDAESQKG